jgi:acyl-ACP thioesterase
MNLRPARVMEWFNEIAWVHANTLGFGYDQLLERNQLWVLGSVSLRFHKQPEWRQKVQVYTHIGSKDRFFYHRDLSVRSETADESYIDCRTRWIVLDATSRRPVRQVEIPEDTPEGLAPLFENAFEKFRIKPESKPEYTTTLYSLQDDIDQNQHVNNSRYITWALECYPESFHKTHTLVAIDAHFKNEGFAGSQIQSDCFVEDKSAEGETQSFIHRISRTSDDTDLCHLKIQWRS